jgi:hypothetical protein
VVSATDPHGRILGFLDPENVSMQLLKYLQKLRIFQIKLVVLDMMHFLSFNDSA